MRLASLILLLFNSLLLRGQQRDTFEVYFPLNDAKLTKEAMSHIDKLVFNDTLIHGDKLLILGYTDYVGNNAHNDSLSRRRARAVKDYLATLGFEKDDISLCVGKGKIGRDNVNGNGGFAADRKVQIVIERTVALASKHVAIVEAKPLTKVDITKLKVNETFAMDDIRFESESPEILPQSLPSLQTLLGYMTQYPTLRIRIEGHICCRTPDQSDDEPCGNMTLSEARALSVLRYLSNHGISKDRMAALGLGSHFPLVKNELTEEDRVKNRRVEIRILNK